jgi:hypothetical protein
LTDTWENAARAALCSVVDDIQRIVHQLQGIHDSLPVTQQERSLRDLDRDPPFATEARAVIQNVLADSLRPAIEDLRSVADYQPTVPAARLLWDLAAYSSEMERFLYGLVVKDNFTAKPLDDPGDVWIPPYTPEQAELKVFFERGRWFVTWKKLEVPEDSPEAESWEVLRLEEDHDRPGHLFYQEI